MKNNKTFKKIFAGAMALVLTAGLVPMTAFADEAGEWREEDGNLFWYENGVKQGLDGRGKEIYDSASDAWYWLDAIDGGKKAVSKDVYQESLAGPWGDYIGDDGELYGKWVRYDENGGMIKGWSDDENGTYFFDNTYGTMAKGYATIETSEYYFNPGTGVLERKFGEVPETGWKNIDGNDYWYEGYVRQGYSVNADYRGKEIYDPASDAWYWLDNVDGGKKAVSKDVYQESLAGQWGDYEGADGERYGKWVRYDENGHMIKGWSTNENGTYYFDPTYGTMAKGSAVIDGLLCEFDENSGILIEQRKMNSASSYNIHSQDYSRWASVVKSYLCEGKEGRFYRIEYLVSDKRIVVEEYNSDNILLDNFDIPMELSTFGGFYEGDDAYFFVFGQNNNAEDNDTEVFRIVKYSKDWQRQGSGSLFGANTVIPFDASSLRMAETDNILYIITGHEMYKSSDGLNHQANVQISLDKDTMEILDTETGVWNISTGYVSHSFNQFIQVDNDRVVTVNHGDAYPRSIVLVRFKDSAATGKFNRAENVNVLRFSGKTGDNYTGASVGGFEVSDTGYLIAGNTVAQDENYSSNKTRNVFLAIVSKDNFSEEGVTFKQVTSYPEGGDYSASTPHLVEISKDRYAVLWEEKVNNGYFYVNDNKVKIAYFDGDGNQIGEIQEIEASLSDCHPIVINDRIMWYTTENGKPQFYYLGVDSAKR